MEFSKLMKFSALIAGVSLTVVGCGGSSSSSVSTGWNGVLVDDPVEGVFWECGDNSGYTGPDGGFGTCEDGTSVTFKIGNVTLGSITETPDYIFTPQDLVGVPRDEVTEEVGTIASLLQSLDADGNPDNGIKITPEIASAFERAVPASTDISDLVEEDIELAVEEIVGEAEIELTFVPKEDALVQLEETQSDIEEGIIETPTQPDESTN